MVDDVIKPEVSGTGSGSADEVGGDAAPTWRVFTGEGHVRPGITLPDPPPWRTFPVPEPDRLARSVYRAYPKLIDAINVAISLRRPLMLTGGAGTGKSSVADAIAHELDLDSVLRWNVTSRTSLEEGLYQYDALGRLRNQQLTKVDVIEDFLRLGPLGTALASDSQRVLLVDELDKGDIDLPGDLLNVLERGEFEIPELARHKKTPVRVRASDGSQDFEIRKGRVACSRFPIIVITSNGEREFPPAFLRRCIRERMQLPDVDRLVEIVAAHLGSATAAQAEELIKAFAAKIGAPGGPAALAIDQLLNTVLMMTRDDVPAAGLDRQQLVDLLQKELRET